jgi:uncharacterized protein (TIGR02246 family)
MSDLSTSAKQEVWEVVQQINRAWVLRQPDRLNDLFDERIVNVGGDGTQYAAGRDACVAGYRSFCDNATSLSFRVFDSQIDVFQQVAVVSYRFEIEYAMNGTNSRESGRDTFVLEKHDSRWLAVWRQLLVQSGS